MIFSELDREILNSYIVVIEGLSDYLGKGYEIVLHSLENFERSVIAIINGHHTGRKVGYPITELALNMLTEIEKNGTKDYISYSSRNRNGEPLRSATIAIRGEGGRIIGLICINLYLNTPLSSLLEGLLGDGQGPHNTKDEGFTENAQELLSSVIFDVREKVYADLSIPANCRNKEIIAILQDRGVFNLKDSVLAVAHSLKISKNTVYLHLRNAAKSADMNSAD